MASKVLLSCFLLLSTITFVMSQDDGYTDADDDGGDDGGDNDVVPSGPGGPGGPGVRRRGGRCKCRRGGCTCPPQD
jgi:hypothetical protein